MPSSEAYLGQLVRTHTPWHQLSAEDIAAQLAAEIDFDTIRLAGWMQTLDGALITEVVQRVLPYPYNYGADVLANAVCIAAGQRTEGQRALTLMGGIGLAVLVMFLLRRS
jgi:folate-dependent phosphoribosylglycinamide formyltransferase PurN